MATDFMGLAFVNGSSKVLHENAFNGALCVINDQSCQEQWIQTVTDGKILGEKKLKVFSGEGLDCEKVKAIDQEYLQFKGIYYKLCLIDLYESRLQAK